jgi:hypothetical protein
MLRYVPHIISKNHTKRSPNAAKTSFTVAVVRCLLHILRAFVKYGHNATRNFIPLFLCKSLSNFQSQLSGTLITATLIKSLCFINSIFIILYVILALGFFKTMRKSLELFKNTSRSKFTQIPFIFISKNPRKAQKILEKIPKSIGPQTLLESFYFQILGSLENLSHFLVLQNSLKFTSFHF